MPAPRVSTYEARILCLHLMHLLSQAEISPDKSLPEKLANTSVHITAATKAVVSAMLSPVEPPPTAEPEGGGS